MFMQYTIIFCSIALALTIHELGHLSCRATVQHEDKEPNIFDGLGFRLFCTHDKWFLRPMAVRLCSLPTSASFVGRPMSGSR